MTDINIVDKIIIVHPTVSFWSGRRKLDPSDIGYNPPEGLVSLGNKRIVPQGALRPFESIKKRLDRTVLKYGVRLIGGYAVPEDCIDELAQKLKAFEQEFANMKADFISNFGQHVDEQVANFPDWENRLRQAAADIEPVLEDKFQCEYRAYKLVPPGSDSDEQGINDKFIRDEELLSQACTEIAAMADKLVLRLVGQEPIKVTFLNYLKAIREKVLNLCSMERKFFGKLLYLIDKVLGEMPDKGFIEDLDRKKLASLVLLLKNANEEPQKTEMLAGNYDDPEDLVKAMGFSVSVEGAAGDPVGHPEEEPEEKSFERPWF